MDIAIVTPELLVGPAPHDPEDYDQLVRERVTAILSLQTSDDLVERTLADAETSAKGARFAFRNVPVTDFDSLDLKCKLPLCVLALDELVGAGHRVYVHCTAGVTRSPTVVAAYLHWKMGWHLEKALEQLHEVRACCPQGDLIRRARPVEP